MNTLYLEGISALLCLGCADLSYRRYCRTFTPEGVCVSRSLHVLTLFWSTAFGMLAACSAVMLALMSLPATTDVVTSWYPWFTFVNRLMFSVFLLLGIVWSRTGGPKAVWPYFVGVILVTGLLLSSAGPALDSLVSYIPYVTRPLDLYLGLLWATIYIGTLYTKSAKVFTAKGFEWYIAFGLGTHLFLAFYPHSGSYSECTVASVLRVAEYLMWFTGFIYIEVDYGRYGHDLGGEQETYSRYVERHQKR